MTTKEKKQSIPTLNLSTIEKKFDASQKTLDHHVKSIKVHKIVSKNTSKKIQDNSNIMTQIMVENETVFKKIQDNKNLSKEELFSLNFDLAFNNFNLINLTFENQTLLLDDYKDALERNRNVLFNHAKIIDFIFSTIKTILKVIKKSGDK